MNNYFNKQSYQRRQQGVVLVMALILLGVISLVAIYTMRGAIVGEQVSKNLRTNAVTMQSAENALRLCEDTVRSGQNQLGGVSFVKNEVPENLPGGDMPNQWKTRANWLSAAGKATLISADLVVVSGMRPLPQPRCMVEQYRLIRPDGDTTLSDPYLVTAVGYSPDYVADANGNAISGSEVWLQSVLRP